MKRKIEEQSDLPQAMIEVFGLPELMFDQKIVDNILNFRLICKFTNEIVATKTKVGELLKQYKALNDSYKLLEFSYNHPMVGVPVYILNFIIANVLFHGLDSLSNIPSLATAGVLGAVAGNIAGFGFVAMVEFWSWIGLYSYGRNYWGLMIEEIKYRGYNVGSHAGLYFSQLAIMVTSMILDLGIESFNMHKLLFYKELMLAAVPFAANNHILFCNEAVIKNDLPQKRADIKKEIKAERLRCSY